MSMILPREPYWQRADEHFYHLETMRLKCTVRKNTLYYRRFSQWLEEEFHAVYFWEQGQFTSMYGFKFQSEQDKTFFLLRWS
jgi:hypothetical protein